MAIQFEDKFQRKFYYLRLSITDVCNFKCNYCLPDGYKPPAGEKPCFLTNSEIERIVKAFARCGTNKVRITGGEPTLRKDFLDIVHSISSTKGIDKVAMTTNGYRMAKDVGSWREAGLTNINVSVDSLKPDMFRQITGLNMFNQVMSGIDRAFEVGYEQVKVNAVLMKDLNSNEFPQFLNWIKDRPIQLRFIELMQTGEMDSFFDKYHKSGVSIQNKLMAEGWVQKVKGTTDGPAKVFMHPDYQGEIGLIMPYEKHFCDSCNRLRISSLGKLHMCLFGEYGVDLRDLLQRDDQQDELIECIQTQLQNKSSGHFLHDGETGMTPHLASIGG